MFNHWAGDTLPMQLWIQLWLMYSFIVVKNHVTVVKPVGASWLKIFDKKANNYIFSESLFSYMLHGASPVTTFDQPVNDVCVLLYISTLL